MKLTVNGEEVEAQEGYSLLDLLNQQGLSKETAVVECNGQILARSQWDHHRVQEGDVLELFRLLGGG